MSGRAPIEIASDDPAFDPSDSDPSVSPTDDFYRFVNGGWLDTNPVPAEYGAWGAGQEVHERNQAILRELLEAAAASTHEPGTVDHLVGIYHRSGMDTERIEALGTTPIRGWLDRIEAMSDLSELRPLVVDMHRSGFSPLFGVGVIPDFEDATVNLLYISQDGLGLPDRDYYFREDTTSQQLLADYRDHVARVFGLLGASDEAAASAAETVLDIETAIADVSYTNVQLRNIDLITNKYQKADIAKLMPDFDLVAYLDGIGAGSETAVNIDNEGFYPAIQELLAARPMDVWRTYLTWNVIRSTASSLPEAFDQASFEFYGTTLGGQKEQKARWKRVLAAGSADIGQAISQLFVRDNFTSHAKARVEHLVDRLFEAMRTTLVDLPWMTDETREEALAKLDGFGYKIGYPDEWRDYSTLELADDTWLDNRLAAHRFEFDRQIDQLGEPVDPHEWSMAPHVVNAYYHPLRNEIVFPAGILQPPFFDDDADDAVNYGAIGAVIGHEITHGFDDQGSRFDADGNVRNWWSEADREEFERRSAVMVEQFSEYEVEDGLKVNGELTLGENIADLGGLKIALMALRRELGDDRPIVGGFTPEQRFFMSWARAWRRNYTPEYLRLQVNSDPHAPARLRCLGPTSNLDDFADAFGVPHDAPSMRQAGERVEIW